MWMWRDETRIVVDVHWRKSGMVYNNIHYYYMALPHEDWELQNSRIWLAKNDIDRGLDFPI